MALYQQIKDGADFAELAREHSDYEETASRGGFWANLPKSDLPPEFADVVRSLKPGRCELARKSGRRLESIPRSMTMPTALEQIAKEERLQALFREKLAETRAKIICGCTVGIGHYEIRYLSKYVLSRAASIRGQASVWQWDCYRRWAGSQGESRFACRPAGEHRVFRPPAGI